MYCSTCGTPISAELSYCNRCGTNLRKERPENAEKSHVAALTTAMVLVALAGIGLTIGGSIALGAAAKLGDAPVVLFMLLNFGIVGGVEIMLSRNLSRVLGKGREPKQIEQPSQPLFQPAMIAPDEARLAHLQTLPEPGTSVTENTTRTLDHSFRQS